MMGSAKEQYTQDIRIRERHTGSQDQFRLQSHLCCSWQVVKDYIILSTKLCRAHTPRAHCEIYRSAFVCMGKQNNIE